MVINCSFAMDNESVNLNESAQIGMEVIDDTLSLNEEIENENNIIASDEEEIALGEGYEPDSNGIYVSPTGSNLGDGSFYSPYKSIDKAIYVATNGKTIYLANATYKITSTLSLNKDLTFTSYDGGRPVIDGQNNCGILKLTADCSFSFNGITFINGHAVNGAVMDFQSYNQYSASFYNCTFINNTADTNGGVFYEGRNEKMFSMSDNLYLISCTFLNNTANQGSIYFGGSNTFSKLTMQYCIAMGNSNYAVFATSNRDGLLSENFWGTNGDVSNIVNYNGFEVTSSKLTIIADNINPTVDDQVILTAKLITSEGADFSSRIYIPEIPIIISSSSGNLSDKRVILANNRANSVFNTSEIGEVLITAQMGDCIVNVTLNVLPSPQYVSANAQDGEGDGSFVNPYSLNDAVNAVNNGAVNKIVLFEGDYTFNDAFTLTTDVSISAYATPYKTDQVSIMSNNGFLILNDNINVNITNLTILNSHSQYSPLFDMGSNSNLTLKNLILKNNTLLESGEAIIANVASNANLNIEYSHIVDNGARIQSEGEYGYLFNNQGTVVADNNWWGSNSGSAYTNYLSLGNEIISDTWFVFSQSQEKQVLRTEWQSTFNVELTDNFNNAIDQYLPGLILQITTNTGSLDDYQVVLNQENSYSFINRISGITDTALVETSVDNEILKTIFDYDIPLTEIFLAVDGDDENGDGSINNPFLSIEKAITRAKESGATIYLLNGTYDIMVVCKNLFHNKTGLNYINNRNLTFSSYNGKVVIDRTKSYFIFGFGSNTVINLIGINFENGLFTSGSELGAIRSSGILTIRDCSFSNVTKGNNFAEFIGISGSGKLYVYDSNFTNIGVLGSQYTNGAIHISGSKAYAYLYNCYFANNGHYKTEMGGVEVYVFGNSESAVRCQQATVDFEKCRFENSSRAVMIYEDARMNLKDCLFKDNGGLSCLYVTSRGYGFNVENCTFINNTAGAIGFSMSYLSDNEINVYNSRFINNTATNGGAISLAKAGSVISNCYFEGNRAVNGGAIYNYFASLLVEHCEFYNNSAIDKGGSIFTEGTDDYIDIQYNIFSNSTANVGGVIYNKGITSLFYNIMTNSSAENGSYIYNENRAGNIYINILNNTTHTVYKNTPVEISAFVSDDMANPITGGEVIFKVNGMEIHALSLEGIARISHVFDKEGTYKIDANYTGSRRYVVIVGQATLNVVKRPTTFDVCDKTVYYSVKDNLTALLKDAEGNIVKNVPVTIILSNRTYLLSTDETGMVSLEYDLPVGNYDVMLKFDGNEDYYSTHANVVIKVLSTIHANDMTRGYNSGCDYEFSLLDVDGTPLANSNVTVKVNGKAYSLISDVNGAIKFNQQFNVGEYYIELKNPISNETITKKFMISKRITNNENLIMDYFDGSSFKVRIIGDDGSYVGAGQTVIFYINKQKCTVKTDKNGYASLKITILPKTYTITSEYKGYKTTNKLTVKQVIKTSNVKVKKSAKSFKIKVTLKTSKGKAIKGKKIILKFKSKTYNAKTNKKGIVTFKIKKNVIKKLKAGKKYTFKVTYVKNTVQKRVIVKK